MAQKKTKRTLTPEQIAKMQDGRLRAKRNKERQAGVDELDARLKKAAREANRPVYLPKRHHHRAKQKKGNTQEMLKRNMNYVVDKAWEIFPVPLLMTDMEVRVQFYVKRKDDEKLRHVANGVKNRLDDKYTVMLAKGERKRLSEDYNMTSSEIYRYLDMELRRIVEMMEAHPEKYMQVV